MEPDLTAQDLFPLIRKLSPAERVRLAKLALREASESGARDREAYVAVPPSPDELGTDVEPLAWDAEGWDEFDASR